MVELIVFIIFVMSLGGAVFILVRKMPVLNALPAHGTTGIKKHQVILDIEHKIKEAFIFFEKQIIMHKLLSWVKVMTLKIETKVDILLHRIRKKAQEVDKKSKR